MVAVPSDKDEIEFKFVGITNLVTPTSMHMHEYRYVPTQSSPPHPAPAHRAVVAQWGARRYNGACSNELTSSAHRGQ